MLFLEMLPMNYNVALKKSPDTLMKILQVIITVASEEDENTDPN